jgi:hypothetical protein
MNNFNDVEFRPLRIWNRCVVAFNLREDSGEVASEEYLKQFTKEEKGEMLDMLSLVKKFGAEEIKRLIMRANPILADVDTDYVH